MDNQEESRKTDNQEGNGTWYSIPDVLQAIHSLSKIKGSDLSSLPSDQSESTSETVNTSVEYQNISNKCEEANVDEEASGIGAGRGILLQKLKKQFSRQKLDEQIHDDLRVVVGPGFSNELIENYFGSASSSSNDFCTHETEISDYDQRENQTEVDFVIGGSDIMKKVNESEKSIQDLKRKARPLRCRNAIILNLTQKQLSEKAETITKATPVLKGPDDFLSNNFCDTEKQVASTSCEEANEPLFTDQDFPLL